MALKGKLELTWVGKYDLSRPEPRLLVEDNSKSYGDPDSNNKLIHGNNMLALKALEDEFEGLIKCIYIDPPFRTGQMFPHYDDSLEHSIWLNTMRDRLELLSNLLSDDGSIFVHIDDNELGHLILLMDEIFNRNNRVGIVTFKQGSATGHKAINPAVVNTSNFILIYAKSKADWRPNRVFTPRARDKRYSQVIPNIDDDYSKWTFTTLSKAFATSLGLTEREAKKKLCERYERKLDEFVLKNAKGVVQLVRPDYDAISADAREMVDKSSAAPSSIFHLSRDGFPDMYFIGGRRILFYNDKVKTIDGAVVAAEPLTTIWDDILSNNLHKEGGVTFPKGKKPEYLVKRIIELATNEGDWVLDSFAGSGTTAAVAHKMNRKWITIEMGDQAFTHCLPRLKNVIDGKDTSGITSAVDWKGGGGFSYYQLAETLVVKDPVLGIYEINSKYDAEMLIRAICKIERFKYTPAGPWHGQSSEKRYIHIYTGLLTQKYLNSLEDNLRYGESLLIYCTKKVSDLKVPQHIEVKRIPYDLLEKCEFKAEAV